MPRFINSISIRFVSQHFFSLFAPFKHRAAAAAATTSRPPTPQPELIKSFRRRLRRSRPRRSDRDWPPVLAPSYLDLRFAVRGQRLLQSGDAALGFE